MSRLNDDIAIEDGDPDIGVDIEDELLNTLRTTLPQNRNVSFVLAAKDSEGCLIGGLTAHASYGWLLIKTLWVAEAFRHRGLGRRFVTQAEERARSLGCHGAWLDTSNPEAMRFYAKLNYECFGQLANQADQPPSSHRRWFLQKQL